MKIKAGIIGTGNIGTDLLIKMIKSNTIDPIIFVGRRNDSDGINIAKKHNIKTSIDGIEFFKNMPSGYCDVVIDCTNALEAKNNWDVLSRLKIRVVDMTPSKIGVMCIPTISGNILQNHYNINMITCGGQSSIPLLNLISKCSNRLDYIEIVSQIASKSAGIATRLNIDHYISTTESAITLFTGCQNCKVILNINPAEPCVNMQTTMFIKYDEINVDKLQTELNAVIIEMRKYIPGYELVMIPMVLEDETLILSVRVKGSGDYLPTYAGNLDIINCAAINTIEKLLL